MKPVPPGARRTHESTPRPEDAASALGNRGVDVVSTVALILLIEEACGKLLEPYYETGEGTVGARVEVDHLAPAVVGRPVRSTVTLTRQLKRRLLFEAEVRQEDTLVMAGFHHRALVRLDQFSKERGSAMAAIPEKYADLMRSKAFAHLSTLMPDGSPQVTPVWFDFDGKHVIVNSAKGRRKDQNMRRDARVALSMTDPENPYRYLEVRGKVVEITEKGAEAHIDSLAKKYLGVDRYPHHKPSDVRVIYKIEPQSFSAMG